MHRGDREPVAGDADEADQSLVARLDGRLAARRLAHRLSHSSWSTRLWSWMRSTWSTPSRSSERRISSRAAAYARSPVFVARKKRVAVRAQPGREPQLGVAVAGGRVDVVDAVLEQQLERAVGLVLGTAERGGAEDDAGALVAGAPEGLLAIISCK